jgi:hypothetical protein
MPDMRADDRAWVEAVDRYLAGADRSPRGRRRGGQGRYVLASALVLALLVSPFAIARTGDVLREGKRNPGSGFAKRETQIISRSKTYSTRQSNTKKGDGGAAFYGCRSKGGREPCLRANNLSTGRAFEFEASGSEGGRIELNDPAGRPLTTNAGGVATGFNADRVDSVDAAKVNFRAAVGTALTDILNFGGLILRASCNAGPDIDVRADSTVPNGTVHIAFIRDPTNLSVYRQDNNLNPGDNFQLLGANDDSAQGSLTYSSPGGTHVTVTFMSEEAGAYGGTVACLFVGTALAA